MAPSQIHYDLLVKDALRYVIKKVLANVAKKGLPDNHYFFITFLTNYTGVKISDRIKNLYPEQLTIVLQHQFWDLKVYDKYFEVNLSFNNIPEKLTIPFKAIQIFVDPIAAFEARFDIDNYEIIDTDDELEYLLENNLKEDISALENATQISNKLSNKSEKQALSSNAPTADVVSLEAFRKNKE